MKNKKIFAIIILAVIVVAGCAYRYTQLLIPEGNGTLLPQGHVVPGTGPYDGTGQVVGGDSDEHGCKASAGYSWCPATNKCQRFWEETCAANIKTTDAPPVQPEKTCTADRRQGICPGDEMPVCATVQVQCIKAPCNPVKENFPDPCAACGNSLVSGYTVGRCAQ